MNVREMFPSKRLDAHDLRDFAGEDVVAVTIESIDYQTKQGKPGEPALDWIMTFVELKKPIKISAMAGYTIAEILDEEENENWPGQVIGIRAVLGDSYGKPRLFVNPYDVGRAQPTLPPKTDLTGFRRWTTQKQNALIQRCLPGASPATTPAGAGPSVSDRLAPAGPIGEHTAASIVLGLRERGSSWDALVEHMKAKNLGTLIVGVEPSACPPAVVNHARAFIGSMPMVEKAKDRDAAIADIIAGWKPPAPAGVDTVTGEVVGDGVPPDDDIPF